MYVRPNFKHKKLLIEALKNGDKIEIFSPGIFPPKQNGTEHIEGPHFPEAHTWYAEVKVESGTVREVIS